MVKLTATNLITLILVSIMAIMCTSCAIFHSGEDEYLIGTIGPDAMYHDRIVKQQSDAESFYRTGLALQEQNKHQLAIEEFREAVRIAPVHAKAYNAIGVSADALGDYQLSVRSYLTALAIDPQQHYILNNLGYSYLLQGRFELAIENFSKALALAGDNKRYLNNLSLAYVKSGDNVAAFEVFNTGSGEAKAHLCLARLFYRIGYYEKAANHFARAAALKPTDSETDKVLSAAVNMAGIYARIPKPPVVHISPIVIRADHMAPTYSDHDGFATIPPGTIKPIELAESNLPEITHNNVDPFHADITESYSKCKLKIPVIKAGLKPRKSLLQAKLKTFKTRAFACKEQEPEFSEPFNSRVKIEVANGNGVRHMASRVGDYLKSKGFLLSYVSNADNFNHTETSISYVKGYITEACRISEELPGKHILKEVSEIQNGNANISILIGSNLNRYLTMIEG